MKGLLLVKESRDPAFLAIIKERKSCAHALVDKKNNDLIDLFMWIDVFEKIGNEYLKCITRLKRRAAFYPKAARL